MSVAKKKMKIPGGGWGSVKHFVILGVMALELFPFYMMLQISTKDNKQFVESPFLPNSVGEWQWDNYANAFRVISPYILNTVFVTVLTVAISLTFAVCGAYFFARHKLAGSGILWIVFLMLMMMPGIANIVTLYNILMNLNLLNSLWALIIVGVSGGQAIQLFILRNFIEDLPRDLFEAAEIDGASHLRQIIHVVFPLCRPIIGSLAILMFISEWNEFLLPLIVLRDHELYTLGVGLVNMEEGAAIREWGKSMAAYVVASLPLIVLFLFTMKLFVRGLAAGAIKG